jgi:hypothetical protein
MPAHVCVVEPRPSSQAQAASCFSLLLHMVPCSTCHWRLPHQLQRFAQHLAQSQATIQLLTVLPAATCSPPPAGVERNARVGDSAEKRKAEIPIVQLNPGGVLNHKYAAEIAARGSGVAYTVIRCTGARRGVLGRG